jgi:diphosphomevalonate decarboxylase
VSRATAVAPSNIAFVKYWGVQTLEEVRPRNASISMTLSRCRTTTTVRHDPDGPPTLRLRLLDPDGSERQVACGFRTGVERHLAALRPELGLAGSLDVSTCNSFPTGAGIASSASGFAALALACAGAAGVSLTREEHSRLARASGSGSACRSAWGGYVEWPGAAGFESASPVVAAEHWSLADVIAVVETSPKEVSSREGHLRAPSSPHFPRRLELLPARLAAVRSAIHHRDLEALGSQLEPEAIELHLVAMSSRPPILYWRPGTLAVLERVRTLRSAGVGAWFTMDAGPNVHVLCRPEDAAAVASSLAATPGVTEVIDDRTGEGPNLLEEPPT